MSILGVSINMTKSVISSEFAEFAKRLKGPGVEYTPIGSGVITGFIRNKFFAGVLMREALRLQGLRSSSEVLVLIASKWPVKAPRIQLASWVAFGLGGVYSTLPQASDHPFLDRMLAFSYGRPFKPDMVSNIETHMYAIGNSLLGAARRHTAQSFEQLSSSEAYFYRNGYKFFVSSSWPTRLLEAVLRLISPGFWFYATRFYYSELELLELSEKLNSGFSDGRGVMELLDYQPVNIYNINGFEKPQARAADRGSKQVIESA